MAHLRDRRAFGNIGTRKFRGARFGDALSPRFSGLLDQYPGAAAAYSLRALTRGWLAGDVVEVRRSSDVTPESFTASQITNGEMLDWVNNGTTDLYNSARYFDGTSTCIKTGGMTASADYFGACTISAEITVSSITASPQCVWALGTSAYRLFISATGQWRANGGVLDLGAVSSGSYSVSVTYDASGAALSLSVDDVEIWSGNETSGAAETSFIIGARGLASTGVYFDGTIHNFSITGSSVKNFAYTGLGTSVTAWEDTIGSNDGTETNGSAYTGQPFDGFVSTWYDQSGFANNATQITTTAQPKIVDAGSLVAGGLSFDGTNDFMQSAAFTSIPQPTTRIGVANFAGNVRTRYVTDGSASNRGAMGSNNTGKWRIFSGTVGDYVTGPTDSSDYLMFAMYSGASSQLYVNNTGLGVKDAGTADLDQITIGANSSNLTNGLMHGTIAEVIVYGSDQTANRTGVEANINAAYTIY